MNRRNELLFVSRNRNKLEEIRMLLPPAIRLLGLADLDWTAEIPEPFDTFEENALAKATFAYQHTGMPCFADDSGLVVDALGGKPGVLSARYAGEHGNDSKNIQKILQELLDATNRQARFVAAIAYRKNEHEVFVFKGSVEGTISYMLLGKEGFGYDPVFIPSGFDKTFGQLDPLVKNNISHRAKAMTRFLDFLKQDLF